MNLHNYNLVIVNSSAGKDSLVSLQAIYDMAQKQNYDTAKIVVSHQDLGEAEWGGTKALAEKQADLYGFNFVVSKRQDKIGYNETLLEYAKRRGKWPSNKQRWCTSDFKRGPGARVVTALTKHMPQSKVLYVFGFRKEESPARSKKKVLTRNNRLTTLKRTVDEYLPIHTVKTKTVWDIINHNNLAYHPAYDLGMPRLSCCFCIFSPFDALVIAGKENPDLLDKYIQVEEEIGHTFKDGFSIMEVKDAIEDGYIAKNISNWIM